MNQLVGVRPEDKNMLHLSPLSFDNRWLNRCLFWCNNSRPIYSKTVFFFAPNSNCIFINSAVIFHSLEFSVIENVQSRIYQWNHLKETDMVNNVYENWHPNSHLTLPLTFSHWFLLWSIQQKRKLRRRSYRIGFFFIQKKWRRDRLFRTVALFFVDSSISMSDLTRNVHGNHFECFDEVQITTFDCSIFGKFLASLNIAARLICLDQIEADWTTDSQSKAITG